MWLVIEATDVISITHKGGWRVGGNNGRSILCTVSFLPIH